MKKRNAKSFDWYGLSQRFSLRKFHFGAASVLLGTALIIGAVGASLVPEAFGMKATVASAVTLQDGQTEYLPPREIFQISKNIYDNNGQNGLWVTEVLEEGANVRIRGGYLYSGGNGAGQTIVMAVGAGTLNGQSYRLYNSNQKNDIIGLGAYHTTQVNSDGVWEFSFSKSTMDYLLGGPTPYGYGSRNDLLIYPQELESTFSNSQPFYGQAVNQGIFVGDQTGIQQSPNRNFYPYVSDWITAYKVWERRIKVLQKDIIHNPALTPVENLTALTSMEREQVVAAIKAANPGLESEATITVDERGRAKVNFSDNSGIYMEPRVTIRLAQDADRNRPNLNEIEQIIVVNKDNLSQDEKDAVKREIIAKNPGLTDKLKDGEAGISVAANGDVTLTYKDDSTDTTTYPQAKTVRQKTDREKADEGKGTVAKTPVRDKDTLTGDDKTAVEGKIRAAYPNLPATATITVNTDGTGKITFQDGSTPIDFTQTDLVTERPATDAPSINPVDSDDTKITGTAPAGSTVTVKNGADTVGTAVATPAGTYEITPITPLPAGTVLTATAEAPGQKPSTQAETTVQKTDREKADEGKGAVDKTPVRDKDNLTGDEKTTVEGKIRTAYPNLPATATVTVNTDGTGKITFQDGSTPIDFTQDDLVTERPATDAPSINPVDSDDTKITGTAPAGSTVTVKNGADIVGTAVATPTGTYEITPITPLPAGTVLTATAEAPGQKPSAPATTTVKPTDAESHNPVAPADKVPVDNTSSLTPEEKDKVKDKVKDANPDLPDGTQIDVADNGDTTITYPDGTTDTIPGTDTVREKDTTASPVIKPVDSDDTSVTGTGVPGATVTVNLPSGPVTATVEPDGTWTVPTSPLPAGTQVTATQAEDGKKPSAPTRGTVAATQAEDNRGNLATIDKTPVNDKDDLTDEEKDAVKAEVIAKNPGLADKLKDGEAGISVAANGDVMLTYADNSTDTTTYKQAQTVRQKTDKELAEEGLKLPAKTPVKDVTALSDTEKDAVKTAIAAANPHFKPNTDIVIGNDGKATITYPDGTKTEIPGGDLVKENDPSPTPRIGAVDTDSTSFTIADAEPGIIVTIAGQPVDPAKITVDNGLATVTLDSPLVEGAEITAQNPETPTQKPSDVDTKAVTLSTVPFTQAPVINPVDTNDTSVTGTGVPGATVTVKIPGQPDQTATVDPAGTWSVPVTGLPEGTEITVTQQAPGEKPSTPTSTTVTQAPKTENPAINPVREDDDKVTGTGVPGATVTVQLPTGPVTTTVAPDGTWSLPTSPIPGGTTITATQTEGDKDPSDPAETTVGHVTATPVIKPVDSDDTEITGTGTPGSTVTVTLPTGPVTTTVNPDGTWTIPTEPLPSGTTLTATQTEPGKEPSGPAKTTVITATTAAPTVQPVDSDDTTVTGTGIPGATITVKVPGQPDVMTTVNPDGTWTADLPSKLPAGTTVSATQTEPGKAPSGPATTTVAPTQAESTTPKVPAKTPVRDKTNLTDQEKDQVKKAIEDANVGTFPAGTSVAVNVDGTATITYPDGSTDTIPGTDLVTERPATKKPTIHPVKPGDTTISGTGTPGGTVTITIPGQDPITVPVGDDGKWSTPVAPLAPKTTITAVGEAPGQKPSDTVTKTVPAIADVTDVTPPSPKVPVKDPGNLTPDEKKDVMDQIKKDNPDLPDGTKIDVDDKGNVTITYPDGSVDVIPGSDVVEAKQDDTPAPTPQPQAPKKVLPSTGETTSYLTAAGLGLAGVLGALGLAKRKKEE